MEKQKEIKNFLNFIDNVPNSYLCVENLKYSLLEAGYQELTFRDDWNLYVGGKYFIIKDAAIIAFNIPNDYTNIKGFNIVASHSDSPSFRIKNNPDIFKDGYLKLNTIPYGAMIYYSWFDRPLSIAGRVVVKNKNAFRTININVDKDLLIIPSQAIHINREVNKKNEINPQKDMLPIISLNENDSINNIISDYLNNKNIEFDEICDCDLYLYNRDKAKLLGLNNDFIIAPRLDNLASVWTSYKGFINSKNDFSINVLSVFNSEEIGSDTKDGADSTFLSDTLYKISKKVNIDVMNLLDNSMVISADNAHAIHPNAPEKNDPTNKVYLGKGVAIKNHTNYSTNALSSSIFKDICNSSNIAYQDFEVKSDLRSGSTLGKINETHVSVDTVDIGIPQLAMHSALETMGTEDFMSMYYSMVEFYSTTRVKGNDSIMVLRLRKVK